MNSNCAIGIDVGGTKIASGIVDLSDGSVHLRRTIATEPQRGGQNLLERVLELANTLQREAGGSGFQPSALGLSVAELVNTQGEIVSDATLGWIGLPIRAALGEILPTVIEADVRAAALAEAHWGGGIGLDPFLYITIGTGVSSCLVVGGKPFKGARGLTGTFASAPGLIPKDSQHLAEGICLEEFSSGPALMTRYFQRTGAHTEAPQILARAKAGESHAQETVQLAGKALGAALAQLVNTLDPQAIILGGGLGVTSGLYRDSLAESLRAHLWSPLHKQIELRTAKLGPDADLIGAALNAVNS